MLKDWAFGKLYKHILEQVSQNLVYMTNIKFFLSHDQIVQTDLSQCSQEAALLEPCFVLHEDMSSYTCNIKEFVMPVSHWKQVMSMIKFGNILESNTGFA